MGDFGPKTWAADGSAWWTLPPTVWQSETLPTQASFLPSLLHRCQNFIIATFRGGPVRQWSGKNLSQRQSAGSAAGIHTGKKEAQGENVQIPAHPRSGSLAKNLEGKGLKDWKPGGLR